MSKVSAAAAVACAFMFATTAAMAQMRDPSIPAGAAVLSGTPSGGYGGGLTSRTVPHVTTTTPSSGFESCGGAGCGPGILRTHRSSARGRL